jgi:hypothetical protein
MPAGRPKDPTTVRVNWRIKKSTRMAIKARIVKGTKVCSYGRVLDETFKDTDV